MIICKICNPNKIGNGYCSKHGTGGVAYLSSNMNKRKIKEIAKLGDVVKDCYDLYKSVGIDRYTIAELKIITKINEIIDYLNRKK